MPEPSPLRRNRLFVPILAGATLGDRLLACLGALVGIGLTGALCGALFGAGPELPLIVAPMGASAVLLFAIPSSPLAQPWPIIGGNTISALVGITVAHVVPSPALAVGIAVGLAILAMSFTRSLHPPGGAAALTAALGGPAVASAGFLFPFVPVAVNSALLVLLGVAFHRLAKHAYPNRPAPPALSPQQTSDVPAKFRIGFRSEDVDAALAAVGETFDIDRADLDRLLRAVAHQAALRSHADLTCADIMSRDVVRIDDTEDIAAARAILLQRNIRILPVIDPAGRLIGAVGLRELATADDLGEAVARVATAAPEDAAVSLLPKLTDGRSHAVVIVDEAERIVGLVTQTDLLAAMGRLQARRG